MKRVHMKTKFSALLLSVALLGGVAASCSPAAPSGPTAVEKFCTFWDKVEEEPPAADNAVLVKDEVVVLADTTTVSGTDCTSPAASIEVDGAVLAEGKEIPSEEGNAASEPIAAVTGEEIAAEQPVLDNLVVKALSAEIGANGITVRGNVAVRLSGVTSTIGFTGTLANLENWSVNLSSTGLTIPGISTSPVVFNGTLRSINGVPSLSLTALASSVKIGDIAVSGASLNLNASPATGVSATVQGSVKVGPSTASGIVDVAFDKAGALVSAHADLAAHLVGTQAGGKKIDLQGTVKLDGNKAETTVSFTGSGVLGDLVINEANGSLALAANKATFVGLIDVADGPNSVRFNGSIVWDGITAYTPFLMLEGAGEFSGTLQDGQQVSVAGSVSTTVVGGQLSAVVTGTFKVGTLNAAGTATVETNGATTTLNVDASLVDAGFAAQLQGVVVITDGRAETVSLDAQVNGAVNLGDVTLTGANLHIGSSYGSPIDLTFAGGLKIGDRADLSGSLAASFGPNGSLISLNGELSGSLSLDSWGLVNFNGTVIASPEQVTLSGSGAVSLINFPLGITFKGSFTSSLTNPSWSLNGSGKIRIASIQIASARLNLSQAVGMKATRAGFYFSILGIPVYFEADFYMQPSGGCSKVDLTGGSFLARPILALVLPGVIGCPVTM